MERELSIRYGSAQIGGNSTFYKLDDVHRIEVGFARSVVEFTFVVVADFQPDFAAACRAAENTFRKPDQACVVALNAANLLDFSHAKSTGFNAMPTIIKAGGPKDTGRSRSYRVRIEFGMPADTGAEGAEGLREATIDCSYTPARRKTVTIAGTWTAIDTTTGRSQYEDEIENYATTVLGLFTGTFELVEEPQTEGDDTNKLLRFRRVYQEIIFGQGSGATGDADIVRQSLRIERQREAPGDTRETFGGNVAGAPPAQGVGTSVNPGAVRLVRVAASYDCWINAENTTDLESKYDNTIKAFIVAEAKKVQDGTYALVEERVEYDRDENRISAVLTALVLAVGENQLIEREVSAEDSHPTGRVLVPVWSGNPLEKYLYQGPAEVRRTVSIRSLVPGLVSLGDAVNRGLNAFSDFEAQGPLLATGDASRGIWVEMMRTSRVVPKELGLDGDTFQTTDILTTIVAELAILRQGGRGAVTTGGAGRPAGEVTPR